MFKKYRKQSVQREQSVVDISDAKPAPSVMGGATKRPALNYAPLTVFGETGTGILSRNFATLIGGPLFRQVEVDQLLKGDEIGYLVVPLQGGSDLNDVLVRLPEAYLTLLREGRSSLIVDHSQEGTRFYDRRARAWHLTLARLNIPARQVAFVTQNRKFPEQYFSWCVEQNISPRVHILNYDYYIKHFTTKAKAHFESGEQYLLATQKAFEERKSVEHEYLCLNYKPRPWRVALLTRLIMDDLWDEGLISFGGLTEENKTASSRSVLWQEGGPVGQFKRLPISKETMTFIPDLMQKGVIFFNESGEAESNVKTARTGNQISSVFHRSGFSLVPETEMYPFEIRVTEKPFKALANYHPAIIFGNHRALQQLKDYGFQTFDRWIDESYDLISSPELRFRAAYDAFLAFRRHSTRLVLEDPDMRDVLVHNAKHAVIGLKRLFREEIDRDLAQSIRTAMPLPNAAAQTTTARSADKADSTLKAGNRA